jgi:crotonobetaine/carnitine-CoA ligase
MSIAASHRPAMVPLEERTVVHMLRGGAELHPTRIAVRDHSMELNYAALLERSRRAGAAFRAMGVNTGDTVLLMLENNVEHVLSWFGASCIGAVEVPMNTASMGPQLAFIANDCEARVLVIEEEYLPRLRQVADQLRHLQHVVVRGDHVQAGDLPFTSYAIDVLDRYDAAELADLHPGDASGIMYTSGTTGTPKGVVVPHALTYGRNWPLGPGSPQQGDVSLITLPIYHVIGQCRGLYNTLIAGGTAVLEERFSASRFWDICRKHNVTYVPLVGVMATYLLAQPAREDDADNPVLRMGLGTTIPDAELFRERFGIPELYVSYGLTEAGGVLAGPAEADGCGYLREDFQARLVDENDIEVAQGDVGELVLRPTEPWTTMTEYYRLPQETLERWGNLWLHTGDLMRQRGDGMFLFAGRLSERIRHKGENISPAAVEEQIAAHPAVAECAVVGIQPIDPGAAPGDNDILAALVPVPGSTIDFGEMVEFLTARLPYFALPRLFRIMDKLPRTESTHRVQRSKISAVGNESLWDRLGAAASSGRTFACQPDPAGGRDTRGQRASAGT